jgi:hypothetical protein
VATVVATDRASVDADYDNGAAVQRLPRSEGRDERMARSVVGPR